MAGKFVKLDYKLIDSPHWHKLTHAARTLYIQIKRTRFKKDSKGRVYNMSDQHIKFGYGDIKHLLSKDTFQRAKAQLIKYGFIDEIQPGKFPNKKAVFALSERWQRNNPEPDLYDSPF